MADLLTRLLGDLPGQATSPLASLERGRASGSQRGSTCSRKAIRDLHGTNRIEEARTKKLLNAERA